MDALASGARQYRTATEPSSSRWPTEEKRAEASLRALELFGISQPAPLLLALIRARRSGPPKLRAKQFNETLQVIERFHFQHTIVAQLRSSGGVSEMYAKAARELFAAGSDTQARANVLSSIRAKLIERRPDREQFLLAFEERFYFTDQYTRESKLIRYLLANFLRHFNPTTRSDDLSIEHILPQSAIKTSADFTVIGSIGNLLLVSPKINQRLGEKPFKQKRQILAGDGAAFDIGNVIGETTWGEREIANRTTRLAESAYDEVWKLPL
ncbi:MAG: HNH endonuclease family protein [Actinomycetota bacterium]